eukprot:5672106-Amphidinium_carterae.1
MNLPKRKSRLFTHSNFKSRVTSSASAACEQPSKAEVKLNKPTTKAPPPSLSSLMQPVTIPMEKSATEDKNTPKAQPDVMKKPDASWTSWSIHDKVYNPIAKEIDDFYRPIRKMEGV